MKKKLLAILTGAAITATCLFALAACGDGKSDNSGIGDSGIVNSDQSQSGNTNVEQSGGFEKISEQQFKNALSVFTAEDYWQYEYEIDMPEEMHYHYDTQKTRCVFDGNNKIVHIEAIQTGSDTVASSTMEQYFVADEKSLTAYSSSELNMGDEHLTIPWSISFSKNFDTATLAEKALRSYGNPVGGFIELPCKTEENGKFKFLSDLYNDLKFEETNNSYSVNAIYLMSDVFNNYVNNFQLTPPSYEPEDTLEVGFKFIFENGKIKKLTLGYLNFSEIFPDVPDTLYSGITYNFSYDEISVTLPEEVKSAAKG